MNRALGSSTVSEYSLAHCKIFQCWSHSTIDTNTSSESAEKKTVHTITKAETGSSLFLTCGGKINTGALCNLCKLTCLIPPSDT